VLAAARSAAPSDGTGWVRVGERLMILVTTRHTDPATWGSWARTRTLAPLDDASAAAVLRRAAPALDDPGGAEALALARRLGGLPLALRLAGAYLATPLARWRTFADYRHALDGDPSPDAVIDLDLPARDPRGTVLRTWDLSLDALTRQGLTQARDLLFLLSCFAPEAPIPESAVAPASRDRLAALRGLATVALIDITPDRHIRMHPVVADTGRARLLTAYRDRLPGIGADAVALVQAAAADLRSDRPADWPAWRSVIPHLRAMLVWLAPHLDEDALTDLVDLGRAASLSLGLGGTRDAGEEELARSNLAAAARLGDEHPAALVARYRLAAALYNGERFAEAEELLRSLLDDRCGLRGPTHPDTLITRDKLADAIMMQGRYAEAERMYRRITTDQHQVLGPDHPRVLATAIDLAYSLGMQGRHDEAADMCRRVLDDSRRVLGADHLTTVSAGAELARWTFEQGHHDAERLCRESLEVHRRLLGVEHHWTLDIGAVLARAIAAQGRHDEAKAMLDELVETMTRVLGETHSLTTRTRHELTALNQTRREAPE
jgi:tetratricopeptide (TPR) repeat protein